MLASVLNAIFVPSGDQSSGPIARNARFEGTPVTLVRSLPSELIVKRPQALGWKPKYAIFEPLGVSPHASWNLARPWSVICTGLLPSAFIVHSSPEALLPGSECL